jgi:hypothetical protein
VQELPTYVDALSVALDSADWAAVSRVAASLQKTAATLGNETLAQFGRSLNAVATSCSLQARVLVFMVVVVA